MMVIGVISENELTARFEGRVIGIGLAVADAWGKRMATRKKTGRTLKGLDAFVAAIAQARDLTLVTPNTKRLEYTGIDLSNPWIELS
jgi:predicted nucleic acid-binding protein